jgi:alanine racemase
MPAQATVNLNALERNCARLLRDLRAGGELCAVVKADGYGHGVLPCARAAVAGGATWLAVSSVPEARELLDTARRARARLLVMGPLCAEELDEAIALDVEVVIWSERYVGRVAEAAARSGGSGRIHVKLDSGMGRLGSRDAGEAAHVVAAVVSTPNVQLAGVMTHFATADEQDTNKQGGDFFAEQLDRFTRWADPIKRAHPSTVVHAANSAATLRETRSHFDMVRCGIAIYGMDPFGKDPRSQQLEPVLELSSYVAEVKRCRAGESTGYGRRFVADHDTHVGLIPIGYGDGWRRGLSNNAEVLVGGVRHPVVGTVSMDSLAIDLGPDQSALGLRDEQAILIGAQGAERITAEEVAGRLDTINYEVTCGLTGRVRRSYLGGDRELPEPRE